MDFDSYNDKKQDRIDSNARIQGVYKMIRKVQQNLEEMEGHT